jgi:hypothetical protein
MFVLMLAAGLVSFASRSVHAHNLGFILSLALLWLYAIIASVGVWQSASKSWASPVWLSRIPAFLCRAIVLLVAARVLLALANGGALTLVNIATGRLEYDP